jgi:hypothetical protein
MHSIFNLDLLTKPADKYCQQAYYDMTNRIIGHDECSVPLRFVLEMSTQRHGEDFGFKKNAILQMVEFGAKL